MALHFVRVPIVYIEEDNIIGETPPQDGHMMVNPDRIDYYYHDGNFVFFRVGGEEIQTSLRTSDKKTKYNECKYDCVYKKKRKLFIEEELGITNFSFFLTEKNYSKKRYSICRRSYYS